MNGKLLRERFDDLTSHLARISNIQYAGQVSMDFVKDLLDSKEQYKKSMDNWRNMGFSSITTGIPVSMAVLSTLGTLKANPFSIISIGGSLVIGAICAFTDF